MRDEQGYDPDEDYLANDNPFWDGTDVAHAAWWRGNDRGCQATAEALKKVALTGVHTGCFGGREIEEVAQLILELHRRASANS